MRFTLRRVAAALLVAGVAAVSYAAGAAQGSKPINMPLSTMKFAPLAPGSPFQIATLWGDRAKGEYAMLLKIPAGVESGRHSHTADYHGVAIQGTWVHTNDGDPRTREFPPGSYVMQPGKQVHNDICKGTVDCIVLVHQHAPGDFIPAKTPQP